VERDAAEGCDGDVEGESKCGAGGGDGGSGGRKTLDLVAARQGGKGARETVEMDHSVRLEMECRGEGAAREEGEGESMGGLGAHPSQESGGGASSQDDGGGGGGLIHSNGEPAAGRKTDALALGRGGGGGSLLFCAKHKVRSALAVWPRVALVFSCSSSCTSITFPLLLSLSPRPRFLFSILLFFAPQPYSSSGLCAYMYICIYVYIYIYNL